MKFFLLLILQKVVLDLCYHRIQHQFLIGNQAALILLKLISEQFEICLMSVMQIEGRIEINEIDGLIGDVIAQDVEVIAEVEFIHGAVSEQNRGKKDLFFFKRFLTTPAAPFSRGRLRSK